MSGNSDDRIDLKPYLKLFGKLAKSLEDWIYKKLAFIILSFFLIVGIFYVLDTITEPKYKVSTTIGKNFVSSEQLKSLLHSIKVNVRANNSPEYFDAYENKLTENFKIFDLNYSYITSLKDSLIIQKETISLEELENDGAVKIELVTNSDTSAVCEMFVDFLNNHPYIKELKRSQIDLHEEVLVSLKNEIKEIDSVISHLIFQNEREMISKENSSGGSIFFNENKSIVHSLFEHRNKLIREKIDISSKLNFMDSREIYLIGDFNQPTEVETFTIFKTSSLVRVLLLSIVAVLVFSFFVRIRKSSKEGR